MEIERTRLSENGRIVIPASFRKALGYEPGEILTLRMDEKGLHVQSQRQAIARAQAMVRKYVSADRSLSDELIAERRLEATREAKRG